MHIFIDESGTFVPAPGRPGVSLVGALVIPDERLARIEKKYLAMRSRLPMERGEVKGRLLDEQQIPSIVELLRKNETLLELVAIDLNFHEAAEIEAHKLGQASGMTSGLTDAHHPNVHAACADLGRKIAALPNQLYVQSVAMFELVWQTCEHAINYYGQRRPRELASFHWTIDGKNKARETNWEELWADIVMPVLQSKSVRKPHGLFEGGDYRYFERFLDTVPDWLPKPEEGRGDEAVNIRLLLMEHFRYSSASEPGLELADIVVNAARRALVGNLQRAGWRDLPRLMIHRRQQYIHLVALHDRTFAHQLSYRRVLKAFCQGGRSMLAPRFND